MKKFILKNYVSYKCLLKKNDIGCLIVMLNTDKVGKY